MRCCWNFSVVPDLSHFFSRRSVFFCHGVFLFLPFLLFNKGAACSGNSDFRYAYLSMILEQRNIIFGHKSCPRYGHTFLAEGKFLAHARNTKISHRQGWLWAETILWPQNPFSIRWPQAQVKPLCWSSKDSKCSTTPVAPTLKCLSWYLPSAP